MTEEQVYEIFHRASRRIRDECKFILKNKKPDYTDRLRIKAEEMYAILESHVCNNDPSIINVFMTKIGVREIYIEDKIRKYKF